jgi:hypothetical protein
MRKRWRRTGSWGPAAPWGGVVAWEKEQLPLLVSFAEEEENWVERGRGGSGNKKGKEGG